MFMDAGFTYFDTAWAYDDSEAVIKEALIDRYPRESFQLATKMAVWLDCETREDALNQFEESLQNTGAGYFDFYLLHDVDEERTKMNDKFKLWDFLVEKKKEGLVKGDTYKTVKLKGSDCSKSLPFSCLYRGHLEQNKPHKGNFVSKLPFQRALGANK